MTPLEKLNQILKKKKSSTTSTSQILLKIEEKGRFQTHFTRPALSCCESQTRTLIENKIIGQYPNQYKYSNPQQDISKTT